LVLLTAKSEQDPGDRRSVSQMRFSCVKKYMCLLIGAALLAACEQKETTVTNPPAEKKESNTTIVNPPSGTTKKEKTDVNVNTSPNP
jgi:uncharacterized lipoprotein YajG